MWSGYESCRPAWVFGMRFRRPVGCQFYVRTLTGQAVREFGADMGRAVVDALTTIVLSACSKFAG